MSTYTDTFTSSSLLANASLTSFLRIHTLQKSLPGGMYSCAECKGRRFESAMVVRTWQEDLPECSETNAQVHRSLPNARRPIAAPAQSLLLFSILLPKLADLHCSDSDRSCSMRQSATKVTALLLVIWSFTVSAAVSGLSYAHT